ncbi:MAG TPA: CRISPR-associated RAMP protein Csx7 [Thermoanaerobaculia bacterium]|nr:CRISPR-associated RAMP protein Csx7 [Thermoanaerobaculia bacterium]
MNAADLSLRHHATLERIVLFEFRLTCQSGLHIGAGKSVDFAGSDLPVVRDASGRPFIPGSSLRGVLRAGIESFCRSLGWTEIHRQTPAEVPPGAPESLAKAWRDLDLIKRLFGAVDERKDAKAHPGAPRDPSYGSRLQISDVICEDAARFEVRDGVAISRETRTVDKDMGAKFDVEVVPAGTRFRGRVRFKNPADYEVGLLAQALWMMNEGILLLGGKSARGLGWVQVEVTAPRDRKAAEILSRQAAEGSSELGPVDQKLAKYLDSLQELADFAAAVS